METVCDILKDGVERNQTIGEIMERLTPVLGKKPTYPVYSKLMEWYNEPP